MVQVDRVPDGKRLVEAVVMLERGDGGRIAGSLLAEIRRDGVRLDRYVCFEVRIGRPFWAREE